MLNDIAISVTSDQDSVTVDLGKDRRFRYPSSLPASFARLQERCKHGAHEPTMSKLVTGFMQARPTSTFLDIGSLYGYFSLLALTASGGRANVYAFEMNPGSFAALERVIAANVQPGKLARYLIKASHVALGDIDALQRATTYKGFVLEPSDEPGHAAAIDFSTLDTFARNHALKVDLVKIDVDGYEDKVLTGASTTFLRDRSVVLLELHGNGLLRHHNVTRGQLLARFLQQGFRVYHFGHQKHEAIDTALALSADLLEARRAKIESASDELVVLSSEDIRDYWPHLEIRTS